MYFLCAYKLLINSVCEIAWSTMVTEKNPDYSHLLNYIRHINMDDHKKDTHDHDEKQTSSKDTEIEQNNTASTEKPVADDSKST